MRLRHLLLAGLVAAMLSACANGDGAGDAVATVDDRPIPRATVEQAVSELVEQRELTGDERAAFAAEQQRQLLTLLIQDEVLVTIFDDVGATIDDADIEAVRDELVASIGGEEQLEATLTQAGMTASLFEDVFVPQQARLQAIQIELAGDEGLETRTARHILLETEEEADEVVAELEDGADFAELAEERSVDPGSGERGGELGPAQRGSYVPPFDDAVWEAELDTVVGPVESDFGFHVLEVIDEDERAVEDLDQQELQQLVGEELNQLVTQAFDAVVIEVDEGIGRWDPMQRTVVPPDEGVGEPDPGTGEEPSLEELDELDDQG